MAPAKFNWIGLPHCGWLAWGLSLLIHGTILFLLAVFSCRRSVDSTHLPLVIDTVVEAPAEEMEIHLTLNDLPARPGARAATPPALFPVVAPPAGQETTSAKPIVPLFSQAAFSQTPTPRSVLEEGQRALSPVVAPPPAEGPSNSKPIVPRFSQATPSPALFPPPLPGEGPLGSQGGGNGAGGAISFFGVAARGKSVVYVLDRSISMGLSGALAAMGRELSASLDRLPEDAHFQVVFYNRHAERLRVAGRTDLLPASKTNKQEVARLLESLKAEGSTEHLPALKLALSLQPDVIYFLTDADDLRGEHVRAVTQLNRGRTSIHTIELSPTEMRYPPSAASDRKPLFQLARDNHGIHHTVCLRKSNNREKE